MGFRFFRFADSLHDSFFRLTDSKVRNRKRTDDVSAPSRKRQYHRTVTKIPFIYYCRPLIETAQNGHINK